MQMQNLSLDKLKKIERMNKLSLNALEQMAIARHIKNYKDMLREDLLIALLKSNPSHTELLKIDDSNTEIGETKKDINAILLMIYVIYIMKSVKKTITNQ